ncbi:hypothetical protein INR49_027772 [Caranx melampygus]|nr:hypothetical protein INR49_027772 [Caranx melampygus]
MTEICFQRCTSRNFNYRNLTMDEERCVDSCAGKLIRSNHRLMGTYVQLMPRMVQRRMEEMESKAKAAEAAATQGAPPPQSPRPGAEPVAELLQRFSPVAADISSEERGVDSERPFPGLKNLRRRSTFVGEKGRKKKLSKKSIDRHQRLKEPSVKRGNSQLKLWMTSSHSVGKATLWLSVCGWTTQRMTSTWGSCEKPRQLPPGSANVKDSIGDDHGFSPLHWACREGRSGVVDMLIMRGARINVMNRGDDTPLHLASSHGHRDIVAKLIQCKADPIQSMSMETHRSTTPASGVKMKWQRCDLVASGAQVCICNRYGQTPLDKAKPHLRQLLQEKAEKMGQSMTKVPYKETFWKGTMRTRPRNGTLNKQAGIDYKQLSLLAKINENQSGELWQGRWQGDEIVVKVLQVRDWTTRKSRDFNEEHPKLRIFSHPNILPVLGACQSPPSPHPIIITHYMPYGSLYNILHQGTTLVVDQNQAVKFALDIASGMAFLHTLEPMVSRLYLNSKHVMIDEDMTARISMADAKFSFQCPGRMYSPAWMAPEALQKRPEDINRRSADMWSFAVLLWELVTREVPFADLSHMEIGMKVALEGLRPTIPPGISPHICKLMRLCMNEDPAKRPKFDMIVPILEKMQDK